MNPSAKSPKNLSVYQRWQRWVSLLFMVTLVACSVAGPTPEPTATMLLPTPEAFTTSTPKTDATVQAFLDAWKAEDYEGMYALLTAGSQAGIAPEAFAQRYSEVSNELGLLELTTQVLSSQGQNAVGQAQYQVTLKSAIVGDISREMIMPLALENGQWRIVWNDGLILPELAGGNYLKMDSGLSERAPIFDRSGLPIAQQVEAVSIGVYPDYVSLADDSGLISLLAQLSNRRYDIIAGWIENAPAASYIPVGELPADQDPRRLELLAQWNAAVVSRYTRRLYYNNGVAPHVVGYVSAIQQEEVATYRRKGYRSDERVGRKGLELWAEDTLMGVPGGSLYVFNPQGQLLSELGSAASIPGQALYTTLERDFQSEVQKAMSIYSGAIVVMEIDSGRVLAMASTPGFDSNAYEIENVNWQTQLSEIVNNPDLPQFNRATQGQYPLGSVFKVITMAAGMEAQRYTAESEYNCQYTFEELPGFTRYDWTYDHFLDDGVTLPSGVLSLSEGLMRSCNPLFWHIGLDLFNVGLTSAIADMSKGFGLGSKTGILGVEEEAGVIPVPGSQVDAINLAIGQGDMLVTPLQVARFMAALGNGGTLYRPQLVEKIVGPDGNPSFSFAPEAQGTLPISPGTMNLLKQAMVGVIRNQNPAGTAYRPMNGLDIKIAGKTGTATAQGDPHAWFAGYTFQGRVDRPDIAIAVIAENAGEGSEIAAPIFRRVVELYFYGKPLKLYRWESAFDVTREPTEVITPSPTGLPAGPRPTRRPNINP